MKSDKGWLTALFLVTLTACHQAGEVSADEPIDSASDGYVNDARLDGDVDAIRPPDLDAVVGLPDPDAVMIDPDATTPDPDTTTPDPDATTPDPDATTPDPDAALPPNAGWIGGPCAQDEDCRYDEAVCLRADEGYPAGTCTLGCERLCPDQDGAPTTFCVDGPLADQGACLQRCDYQTFSTGCRPGYRCEPRGRYGEPATVREICLPGEPDPEGECLAELRRLGLGFARAQSPSDHPEGRPDFTCTIEEPVRLSSPVLGVSYRSVWQETATPIYGACVLAEALAKTSELLAEYGIVEVGHMGTYNCRLIAGTDRPSQHSLGLAIDFGWFRDADGQVFDVEAHWEHDRTEGFETEEGRVLYEIAWQLYERQIFAIVLTPNYNAAHDNHFHVDLTPGSHFLGKDGPTRYFGPNLFSD